MALATTGLVMGINSIGIGSGDALNITSFDIFESVVKIFVGLLGSGLVFMSIGYFFSSMSKNSIHQDAVSVLFVLLIILITIVGKVVGNMFGYVVNFFTNEAFKPFSFISGNINLIAIGVNIFIFVLMIVLTYSIYNNKELKY